MFTNGNVTNRSWARAWVGEDRPERVARAVAEAAGRTDVVLQQRVTELMQQEARVGRLRCRRGSLTPRTSLVNFSIPVAGSVADHVRVH